MDERSKKYMDYLINSVENISKIKNSIFDDISSSKSVSNILNNIEKVNNIIVNMESLRLDIIRIRDQFTIDSNSEKAQLDVEVETTKSSEIDKASTTISELELDYNILKKQYDSLPLWSRIFKKDLSIELATKIDYIKSEHNRKINEILTIYRDKLEIIVSDLNSVECWATSLLYKLSELKKHYNDRLEIISKTKKIISAKTNILELDRDRIKLDKRELNNKIKQLRLDSKVSNNINKNEIKMEIDRISNEILLIDKNILDLDRKINEIKSLN